MTILHALNEILEVWEPLWLFFLIFAEAILGAFSLYILIKEYNYDAQKDIEKKQRRTKTTKKTTRNPGGSEITEESREVFEPIETEATNEKDS